MNSPSVNPAWEEETLDLQTYWRVLKRRRGIFLTLFGLTFLTTLIWTLLTPPRYEGEILLKMAVGREIPIVIDIPGLPTTTTDPFQTQMEILRSRALAERVARRLGLGIRVRNGRKDELFEFIEGTLDPGSYRLTVEEDRAHLEGPGASVTWSRKDTLVLSGLRLKLRPQVSGDFLLEARPLENLSGDLQNRLKVAQQGHTDLVSLKITAESPELAADLANAYGEEYLAFVRELNKRSAISVRTFIEAQLEKVREELRAQEESLMNFKKREGLLTLEGTAQTLVTRFSEVEAQLQDAQLQEQETQQVLDRQRERLKTLYGLENLPSPPLPVASLQEQLIELETERQKLLSRYTEDHPEVQLVERQIREIQEQVRKTLQGNLSKGLLQGDPVLAELIGGMVESEARLVGLQARQKALTRLLEDIQAQMRRFPEKELRYMELAREVEAGRALFRLLLQRLEEARIAEAQENLDAGIIDRAYPKKTPVAPNMRVTLLMGLVLGLMLGVGGAFAMEYLDRTPQDPREAEQLLGVPVLTLIPQVETPEQDLPFLEGIKGWASSLLLLTKRKGGVFAITSALPGDGKSTLAEGLARYLADLGQKVLLVDGDFRRPQLHKRFKKALTPGLTDVLTGEVALGHATLAVTGNLSFLPAGTPVSLQNGRILFNYDFPTLWGALGERYPWVLIDSPPVMAAPELPTVLQGITGVLLVLRTGSTPREAIEEAKRILDFAGIPIVGAVLNGLKRAHLYGGYEYRYAAPHLPTPARRRFWPWSRSSM